MCSDTPNDDKRPREISVLLPTYNERANLSSVVKRIDSVLRPLQPRYEIVVIDDDSPDRTYEVAKELADRYPVRVIKRTNEVGLATAVVRGIDESHTDKLIVMDADLQHPPERIPDLLSELETHDLVVASRFVNDDSVSHFGLIRQTMTFVANLLAWLCFPRVRSVSDPQSGFFALRRSVIENIDLDPIGYKILIEIIVRGEYDCVTEVGYEFDERAGGHSNMTMGTIVNYLRHLGRLLITKRIQR